MSEIEKLKLKFTSGNDIPVERSMVYKHEFDAVYNEFREVLHQRNVLMQGIADAAAKAGITDPEAFLDGPMCLLVLEDMAEELERGRDEAIERDLNT